MNRGIKFRVWDKDEKIMNYNIGIIGNRLVLEWEFDKESKELEQNCYVDIAEDNKKYFEIMQYTGLKDINNKEIYEGDLCKEFDKYGEVINSLLQIVWSDKYQYGVKVLKGGALSRNLTFPLWQWDGCEDNGNRQLEVIGNIYENPELLED